MKLNNYEIKLIKELQKYKLDNQCLYISKPFNTNILIFILSLLCLFKIITFKEFFYIGFSVIIILIFKPIFKRKRPFNASLFIDNKSNINFEKGHDSYSFPSGHSVTSMVFYLVLLNKYNDISNFIAIIPLLVGFSRIYLGVHFPSDVISGFIFGAIYYSVIKNKL